MTNIPNCSINNTWTGCEALVEGALLLAKRVTDTLNSNNKIPMFANPGSFVRPENRGKGQKIWLNETRLVDALEGTKWQLYYEGARGDSALSAGTLASTRPLPHFHTGHPFALCHLYVACQLKAGVFLRFSMSEFIFMYVLVKSPSRASYNAFYRI